MDHTSINTENYFQFVHEFAAQLTNLKRSYIGDIKN